MVFFYFKHFVDINYYIFSVTIPITNYLWYCLNIHKYWNSNQRVRVILIYSIKVNTYLEFVLTTRFCNIFQSNSTRTRIRVKTVPVHQMNLRSYFWILRGIWERTGSLGVNKKWGVSVIRGTGWNPKIDNHFSDYLNRQTSVST